MTVIARDAVASDHLVYAWPFPIGPECEVTCAEDEQVVMCPSWTVGDRLGPGRHHWRTPDPMRPVAAFFVLTAPVEASFDMTTMFMIPTTGQPIRIRAAGSLQVRCADPALLIAQFVGLPFDSVNDGILRSVSRSIERMLARLLTRRVVMAGSPIAVTDPGMLPGIVEELVAYNPTAGAVFGIELIRMGHLAIGCDDASTPQVMMPMHGQPAEWSGRHPTNGQHKLAAASQPEISLVDTARGRPANDAPVPSAASSSERLNKSTVKGHAISLDQASTSSSGSGRRAGTNSDVTAETSGEINVKPKASVPVEVPRSADDITQPGVRTPTPAPGAMRMAAMGLASAPVAPAASSSGSILGIGVGMGVGIGMGGGAAAPQAAVSGEIGGAKKSLGPGARVLVPGPNGLMQSATVRQLMQGYYELEVGHSGETIWVPVNGVVPE
jgi:hypothetical protein